MTVAAKILACFLMIFLIIDARAQTTLKEAFKDSFLIGAAINDAVFFESNVRDAEIVKKQFNTISPENILKWESVHPNLDTYNFTKADRYVEFGEKNKMFIVGHNLIWHQQTPKEVFMDAGGKPVDRKTLLERMRGHIQTVVGRYKGRIKGWDVVNEALNEDGSLRRSNWLRIIGEDYIAKAFQFAHEADPNAELYYNDYSLESEPKRKGALKLIKKLKSQGIPVTAVGLQGHDNWDFPTLGQQEKTITDFAALGVKIMITELDIDVLPVAAAPGADINIKLELKEGMNPYKDVLPPEIEQKLAQRYADLFKVFLKHKDVITRVTFWGVTDAASWLNNYPVRGRTNYPLLFDRNGNAKPAFAAIIKAVSKKEASRK
jgi:endo-1,4-beta-xylanase